MHRRPASIPQACCSTLRQEGPWDRFCSTSPRTGGQIADKAHSLTQHHSPSVVGPQGRQGGQKPCPHGARSLERKDVCTGNDTAQSASHNRYRVSGKHVKGPGKAPEMMEPWYWATKKRRRKWEMVTFHKDTSMGKCRSANKQGRAEHQAWLFSDMTVPSAVKSNCTDLVRLIKYIWRYRAELDWNTCSSQRTHSVCSV